jgi:hypothetical protein
VAGRQYPGHAQDVVPSARYSPYGTHLATVSKTKLNASYSLVDIDNNNNHWIKKAPGSPRHGDSTLASWNVCSWLPS